MSRAEFEGRVERVAQGRNGRLFIAELAPDADEILTDNAMPPWRLKRWRLAMERHARLLASRSIPLVMLIAPEAPTVFPDDLPEGWPRPGSPPGRVFAEAMAGIENLAVVYPLQALRDAEGGIDTYKKNDTHWSAYGAFIGYRGLVEALPPTLPIRRIEPGEVTFSMRPSYGNLGAHADFDLKLPVPHPQVDGPSYELVRRTIGLRRYALQISRYEGATARALLFRDSFSTEMEPFLLRTFGEAWCLGPTQDIDHDVIDEANPDVVIVQTCERRLVSVVPDHIRFNWREVFDLNMTSAAGKLCGRMVETQRVEGPVVAAELAPEVARAEGLQPQHLIQCADVLLNAKRLDDTKRYARRALQLDPSLLSGWRLIAMAEAYSPEPDARVWSQATRRMLKGKLRNPRFVLEYAAGLQRMGQTDQSIQLLREAVVEFRHSSDLRILLAQTLLRLGDREAAEKALSPALELMDPRSAHYIAAERFLAGGELIDGPRVSRA